jgi:hypothetical protein
MKVDRDTIVRAAQALVAPGGITELRALRATTAREAWRTNTLSGYFDSSEKLAEAVAEIVSASGVYVVINEVNPALLARAANRLLIIKGEPTTADHDIVRRRWLPIDLDPVRPTGISATSAERSNAGERADLVEDYLRRRGWPDPIRGDSGNGVHLLYRIDVSANDDGLIARCLARLDAYFSDEHVKLDTKVHNPSRIWKLYGTPACKGDSTTDRPHRMSRLVRVPEPIEVVPMELLASQSGPPSASVVDARPQLTALRNGFELREWIERSLPDAVGPKEWKQGGSIWELPVCPWNADHVGNCAFVGQLPSGAIVAGCHHNSCAWDWHDLRARFEPTAIVLPPSPPEGAIANPKCLAKWPTPVPLSALGPSEPPDWLWDGRIAREHTTLLVGLWKAGKTTLVAHMLASMGNGRSLAGDVTACRVLVVSEESAGLWARRRDQLKIGDHVHVLARPFRARLSRAEWSDFIDYLASVAAAEKFDLVVLDPLSGLWPVRDENDAADVQAALAPLGALTATGAAVLLLHHPRKGDAGEAQVSRGSGALPAYVDSIVELRRLPSSQADDRRRTLKCYGRFDNMPEEVVVELSETGYRAVGTVADASRADRIPMIASILIAHPDGLTVDGVADAWSDGDGVARPGKTKLRNELDRGFSEGRWHRAGDGVKGKPHRYMPQFDSSALTPTGTDETNQSATQT